ncbi:hypothetical protein S7335_1198 [Synechococcus sp. PCC 7335]|nr:hypothetical protein S7335_1153 [Synechococcus sp. PCC 7335]EDX82494.1 hypothetical protein S7335_1198 [Synechococcus sp. PCC 7335]
MTALEGESIVCFALVIPRSHGQDLSQCHQEDGFRIERLP